MQHTRASNFGEILGELTKSNDLHQCLGNFGKILGNSGEISGNSGEILGFVSHFPKINYSGFPKIGSLDRKSRNERYVLIKVL